MALCLQNWTTDSLQAPNQISSRFTNKCLSMRFKSFSDPWNYQGEQLIGEPSDDLTVRRTLAIWLERIKIEQSSGW